MPLIAFGEEKLLIGLQRECHGEIMTPRLTYGDRMGTTNHDMECIKESFFPSKLLLKHFQVLDKFISLEMFYTGGTLFRLQLMRAGRIKYRVCPHAF